MPCAPFVQGNVPRPAQSCCDNLNQLYGLQPGCLCLLNDTTLSAFPINKTLALQSPVLCKLQANSSTCSGLYSPPGLSVSLGANHSSVAGRRRNLCAGQELQGNEVCVLDRDGEDVEDCRSYSFPNHLSYGTSSFTNIFVGHIGNLQLSAVTISLTAIRIFSFGFLLGMGSALETLCGQAFDAGQIHLLGVYMQRSWIILLASCVLVSPFYIFATPILKFLGQGKEIVELAGQFTILTMPQLFSLAINFLTGKFLQTLQIFLR